MFKEDVKDYIRGYLGRVEGNTLGDIGVFFSDNLYEDYQHVARNLIMENYVEVMTAVKEYINETNNCDFLDDACHTLNRAVEQIGMDMISETKTYIETDTEVELTKEIIRQIIKELK